MAEIKYNDKVKFKDDKLHALWPYCYPAVGTVGLVVESDTFPEVCVRVQWPKGSTAGDGCWTAPVGSLEVAPYA